MITINYLAVLVSAVLVLALGSIWYGPVFGKAWMRINNMDTTDLARRKEMQKKAIPLYVVQFLLSLFQYYVLAHYIAGWTDASGLENALWIWAAFVMPTIAGSAMWTADSAKVKWARFGIQSGYQLVVLALVGVILACWK